MDERDTPGRSRLFVAWQDPDSRMIHPVALLVHDPQREANHYVFGYLKHASQLPDFLPFTAFPDLHRLYEAKTLFPFFANRIMSTRRSDYAQWLELFDLPADATPFTILAQTNGWRATDRVEVFSEPVRDPATGRGHASFFLRGIRHVDGAEEAIDHLQEGDRLDVVFDVQNRVNSQALLLLTLRHRSLGYVPDYLVSFLHDAMRTLGPTAVEVKAKHVNPARTPRHIRVMCEATMAWPPECAEAFSGPEFCLLAGGGGHWPS